MVFQTNNDLLFSRAGGTVFTLDHKPIIYFGEDKDSHYFTQMFLSKEAGHKHVEFLH